jgi:hypothetical protein
MNAKERYQKLYNLKLQEFVTTKNKLDKLEKQLGLLENWLAVEELEEEAKALESTSKEKQGEKNEN